MGKSKSTLSLHFFPPFPQPHKAHGRETFPAAAERPSAAELREKPSQPLVWARTRGEGWAPHSTRACRARGCARSQPLAPSAPSPGNRHWVLQPEAPGITFSCGTRAAGAHMGSAWGTQICQNQTAQLWMPLITRSRAWCNTGPAQVRCKGQAGSTWV